MSKGESKEYRTRLKEITSVLHKYGITRGITPQKLRMILEDLGPTYIKIGQIMSLHSDILPKRYCDELMCLRSEVTPMEFPEVKEVIEARGGKVTGSVTSKTNYLINNDVQSTSSKNKKARELGIPILSEEDFLQMLERKE